MLNSNGGSGCEVFVGGEERGGPFHWLLCSCDLPYPGLRHWDMDLKLHPSPICSLLPIYLLSPILASLTFSRRCSEVWDPETFEGGSTWPLKKMAVIHLRTGSQSEISSHNWRAQRFLKPTQLFLLLHAHSLSWCFLKRGGNRKLVSRDWTGTSDKLPMCGWVTERSGSYLPSINAEGG